jgi:hypothetical protein
MLMLMSRILASTKRRLSRHYGVFLDHCILDPGGLEVAYGGFRTLVVCVLMCEEIGVHVSMAVTPVAYRLLCCRKCLTASMYISMRRALVTGVLALGRFWGRPGGVAFTSSGSIASRQETIPNLVVDPSIISTARDLHVRHIALFDGDVWVPVSDEARSGRQRHRSGGRSS